MFYNKKKMLLNSGKKIIPIQCGYDIWTFKKEVKKKKVNSYLL
jgi:hypothetical protein